MHAKKYDEIRMTVLATVLPPSGIAENMLRHPMNASVASSVLREEIALRSAIAPGVTEPSHCSCSLITFVLYLLIASG